MLDDLFYVDNSVEMLSVITVRKTLHDIGMNFPLLMTVSLPSLQSIPLALGHLPVKRRFSIFQFGNIQKVLLDGK